MSELSEQFELLSSGSIEIAFIYDGLTELRKSCVKMVVFSLCEDMKNPYSTFEADLQRDLDMAKKSKVGLVRMQGEDGSHLLRDSELDFALPSSLRSGPDEAGSGPARC